MLVSKGDLATGVDPCEGPCDASSCTAMISVGEPPSSWILTISLTGSFLHEGQQACGAPAARIRG